MTKNKLAGRKTLIAYAYLLPGMLVMAIFILIPILLSFYMSFFKIESIGAPWEFAGFRNFKNVFAESTFFLAFVRTLGFGVWGMATGLGLSLFTSLLIAKHRALSLHRYLFYLPAVVSAITMGKIYNLMLMPNETGLLNIVISWFGASASINWLGDPKVAYLVVMMIGLIGLGGGMNIILFTTAINNVPKELEEAARLEGATGTTIALKIHLPMIKSILSSVALLSIIGSFKSFELIYALTGGGPQNTTTTLAILLYNTSLGSVAGYGGSAAMGFLLTIIVLVFTIGYMKISNYTKQSEVEM